MKNILLFGQIKDELETLAKKLRDSKTTVDTASFEDLRFWIDGEETQISLANNGKDLREYAMILALSTPEHDKNHAMSALACYCRKYGIKLMDDAFTNVAGKLYAMWRFWEEGISVPKTAFGPAEFLEEILVSKFGGIGVLKATNASRGRDNYLVRSPGAIAKIMAENPKVQFILQNFIPNDGDYRIEVLDFEPKMAIFRSAHGNDFRNNTSLGGSASIIPLPELDPKVIKMAAKAAKALNIKIAGADIMQNRDTGEYVVLEVNRTPQLTSGSFTDEKAEMIKDFIAEH